MRIETTDAALHRVGLNKAVMKLFKEAPVKYYMNICSVFNSNQAYEIFIEEGDFGMPGVIGQGTPIPIDDFAMPWQITVTPKKRAIGFSVGTEAVQSEQGYGVISNRAGKIALAMLKGLEAECANHVNLATSAAAGDKGPDGLALASTAHTLADGSTQSNLGVSSTAVTLGILNLEGMVQEIRSQKSHRGDPFPAMGPYVLMVPPSLEFLARRISGAGKLPQTNDNDENVLAQSISKVVVNPYFTGTGFMLRSANDNEHGLGLLMRREVVTNTWNDWGHDAIVTGSTQIYCKFNRGWRGVQYSG